MTTKYHISDNGPRVCKARKVELCPYGASVMSELGKLYDGHQTNKDDAIQTYEAILEYRNRKEGNGFFPVETKKKKISLFKKQVSDDDKIAALSNAIDKVENQRKKPKVVAEHVHDTPDDFYTKTTYKCSCGVTMVFTPGYYDEFTHTQEKNNSWEEKKSLKNLFFGG